MIDFIAARNKVAATDLTVGLVSETITVAYFIWVNHMTPMDRLDVMEAVEANGETFATINKKLDACVKFIAEQIS